MYVLPWAMRSTNKVRIPDANLQLSQDQQRYLIVVALSTKTPFTASALRTLAVTLFK